MFPLNDPQRLVLKPPLSTAVTTSFVLSQPSATTDIESSPGASATSVTSTSATTNSRALSFQPPLTRYRDIQLCLAHFCEIHGPIPLMVTEAHPVPCDECADQPISDAPRPKTSSNTIIAPESKCASRSHSLIGRSLSATTSTHEAQTRRAALRRATGLSNLATCTSATVIETPPESPADQSSTATQQTTPPPLHRRDAARLRRTYDDFAHKVANPCENCVMKLPKNAVPGATTSATANTVAGKAIGVGESQGAAQSLARPPLTTPTAMTPGRLSRTPSTDSRSSSSQQTLRTRAPHSRVSRSAALLNVATPPKSRDGSTERLRASFSSSASSRGSSTSHVHYLDYTSSHQPSSPETLAALRNSCLRALSQETLPTSGPELGGTVPLSPCTPSFAIPTSHTSTNTHNGGVTGASGPILFGDPVNGFTTGYLFRVVDVHARGQKRLFAFLALSTSREHQVMREFGPLSGSFRDLAAWIQRLVTVETDRLFTEKQQQAFAMSPSAALSSCGKQAPDMDITPTPQNPSPNLPPRAAAQPHPGIVMGPSQPIKTPELSEQNLIGGGGGYFDRALRSSPRLGSFLAGGSGRRYSSAGCLSGGGGGGGGGGTINIKARGLTELVGMDDFFVKLHREFVKILLELDFQAGSR